MLILVIECFKTSSDIIELHDRVAKVRLVAVQNSAFELLLVLLEGNTIVLQFNALLFAVLHRGLSLSTNSNLGGIFILYPCFITTVLLKHHFTIVLAM